MKLTDTQKRLLAGLGFGLALFLGTILAGPDEEDQRAVIDQACRHAAVSAVPGSEAWCTHGGDPRLPVPDTAREARLQAVPADQLCPPAHPDGYEVLVFYGYPEGTENRARAMRSELRSILGEAQARLDISHNTHTQRIRFDCNPKGLPRVRRIKLPAIGEDGAFGFDDVVDGLQAAGYHPFRQSSRRVFSVFVDSIGGAYPYCGEGTVGSPGFVGGHVSLVGCINERTFLHELGHNLGAVGPQAPHTSGAYHCHEGGDVMCYDDGGPYFRNGGRMSATCSDVMRFDCGLEDYWDPVRDDLRAYNVARSPFLTEPEAKT